VSIVLDEAAVPPEARVTIHLKDIALVEALRVILRTQGLAFRFEEQVIWVSSPDRLC
jgi:hypothetical protein